MLSALPRYTSGPLCRLGGRAKHTLPHLTSCITQQQQQQQQQQKSKNMGKPAYDYFLVLDFEATCVNRGRIMPQEIIEFPVLKVNAQTFVIEDKFHKFVQPVHHPELTDFCIELTGILQDEVDDAAPFKEVFEAFIKWMEESVGLDKKVLFVTCGNWDLQTMLPDQCRLSNVPVPPYCKQWLNIKKSYAITTGEFTKGIMPMLKGLRLKHEGRLHSGIDDCKNIANILKALADLGCRFYPTYEIE